MDSNAKRLLFLCVSCAYAVIRWAYRRLIRLHGTEPARPPVVLMYHGVSRSDAAGFERQMSELKTHATLVFADESLPSNGRQKVAVTFDDAFMSVFEHAIPVMTALGVPATIFVPTGYLGAEPGWIPATARTKDWPGQVASAEVLRACDPRQIRIASHSVTHPHLAEVDGRVLRDELVLSRQALERMTSAPIEMLSLPYGSCSTRVLSEAAASGYKRVFANIPVGRGPDDHIVIGRISVSPRDWMIEFRLKTVAAYDWLAIAIRTKRTLYGFFGRLR